MKEQSGDKKNRLHSQHSDALGAFRQGYTSARNSPGDDSDHSWSASHRAGRWPVPYRCYGECVFFTGIPGFVNYLAKQLLENCRKSATDVLLHVAVDAENTPRSWRHWAWRTWLSMRAGPLARTIAEAQEHFVHQLRLVF